MAFSSTKTNRKLRNSIGAVFGTVPVATFSTFLWLFFSYSSSHPTQPHPELGLIHRLSNHGSYVYISDSEVTGLSLLMIGFLVGFMLAAAIIPKDFVPPPAQTPRWVTYVSVSYKTDAASADTIILGVASLLVSLFVIWFAGRGIVDFVTSHGVVLDLGF